jgi:hypothetical protein
MKKKHTPNDVVKVCYGNLRDDQNNSVGVDCMGVDCVGVWVCNLEVIIREMM